MSDYETINNNLESNNRHTINCPTTDCNTVLNPRNIRK